MAALPLACRREGKGPPLVCLHGLLGSGRNWSTVAAALGGQHSVILPDLRNHGRSPWSAEVGYAAMANDILALLDSLCLERAAVLGHSLGGKVAMTLALAAPARVERLIVVDIAPVAYRSGLEAYLSAMLAIDPARLTRRAEVDAALAPAVPEPPIRAFLLQNLEQQDGRYAWRPNLAALLAGMPAIRSFPDQGATSPYPGPCCVIRGDRSAYVRDEHWPAIRARFPRATLHTVEGAGHWVHADQPSTFLDLVRSCLAEPALG